MQITDENNKTIHIQSIDKPIATEHFWILDLINQDWMLTKLVMLEEFTTPTLTLNIKGNLVEVPAEWNILVYSPETSDVDMVRVSDLTKSAFTIFLYNFVTNKVLEETARVVGYNLNSTVRTPSFNKSNMLCHPIADRYWIMIAPTDTYNKYFKDTVTVGNFLY